jgi:hypothetical protein
MSTYFWSIFCGSVAVFCTTFAMITLGINYPILLVLFYGGIAIIHSYLSIGFMDLDERHH